ASTASCDTFAGARGGGSGICRRTPAFPRGCATRTLGGGGPWRFSAAAASAKLTVPCALAWPWSPGRPADWAPTGPTSNATNRLSQHHALFHKPTRLIWRPFITSRFVLIIVRYSRLAAPPQARGSADVSPLLWPECTFEPVGPKDLRVCQDRCPAGACP